MNVLLKAPEIAFQLENSRRQDADHLRRLRRRGGQGGRGGGGHVALRRRHRPRRPAADDPAGAPFEALLAGDGPGPQLAARGPADPAVIIYTSGTTGTPKGAVLSHIGLYMNADIPGRLFEFAEDDVAIVALPLFHVFALSSIMNTCVLLGGTMTLVPRFDPGAVLQLMQRDRVTVFMGVPTMYIALLQAIDAGDYDLASLRVAVSGGAPIPAEVIDAFESRFGVPILEGYGLSESSSTATFNISVTERKVYSVGKPIWGTSLQIWDDEYRPLPPGADHVGEVVLRGMNIMTGYYDNPEATAKAFAGGWFHTGDLGYLDEDGFLFIVDRIKDLIIRGGYNVYPREVEEVLYAHPAVAEAAVIGVPDRDDGRGGARRRRRQARAVGHRGGADPVREGARRRLQVPAGDRVQGQPAQGRHRQDPQEGAAAELAGSMTIFACLPGAASASNAASTPARPTVPVAIGAAVTFPSASRWSVSRNSSGV